MIPRADKIELGVNKKKQNNVDELQQISVG